MAMHESHSGISAAKLFLATAIIIAAGVAAYSNALTGEFVYDDITSIVENHHIKQLWPISEAMSLPLLDQGKTVSRRPLLSLSFALNYWAGQLDPRHYHVTNLAIHLTAALLLFGIVRRVLNLKQFTARFSAQSLWMATAICIIWLVHPIQTESVTYIAQRAESLMGMCYLLVIYAALRAATSNRSVLWFTTAVLACAAGMAVKEVMVTAPILVFLFDGIFVFGTFKEAWERRRCFYLALASTWLIPILLSVSALKDVSQDFVGDGKSPLAYAYTQPMVILYYLWLSFWPSPSVMDYSWGYATNVFRVIATSAVVAV